MFNIDALKRYAMGICTRLGVLANTFANGILSIHDGDHGAAEQKLLENAGSGSSEKDEALRSAKLRLCWGHSFTLELACFRFDIRNTHLVHAHISRKSAPGPCLKGRWDYNCRMFSGKYNSG